MSWSVRAQVVDIRNDTPNASDALWIDTNVWIWLTSAVQPPKQSEPYVRYVATLRQRGARLMTGAINLAELAKHVEHTELALWQARSNRPLDTRELKIFRSDPTQRKDVVDEIGRCWRDVTTYAALPVDAIEKACVSRAASALGAGDLVDGGDAIMLADARRNGFTSILTDDADFATVDWITLFTSNLKVINEARGMGRLLTR